MKVPSAKPCFRDMAEIVKDLRKVLRSGRLILGPYTRKFEQIFQEYIGVRYSVATSSCTSALEICLRHVDVRGKEVIIPANTFIACPNSVIYAGGKPVFCDINPETFCMGANDVQERTGPNTRVVMAVHMAGLPVPEIEEIKNICVDHKLFLLEDSAHAHGATINGKKVGSIGDAGCFSLYPTKIITTLVGGMITTNDKKLYNFSKSVRHHGQGESLEEIVNFGNDWLMDEMRAVIGIYQLKNIEKFIEKRNQIARKYMAGIDKINGASYYKVPKNVRRVYYKFLIKLDKNINKRKLTKNMKERGIEIGTLYSRPVYLHPIYQGIGYKKGLCPKAEEALEHQIALPMHVWMNDEKVRYVLKCLEEEIF